VPADQHARRWMGLSPSHRPAPGLVSAVVVLVLAGVGQRCSLVLLAPCTNSAAASTAARGRGSLGLASSNTWRTSRALSHMARYNSQLIFDVTAESGMVGLGGWRLDQDEAQGSRAVHAMNADELDINGGAGTADPGERAPGAH
jgi:hypothetical protein